MKTAFPTQPRFCAERALLGATLLALSWATALASPSVTTDGELRSETLKIIQPMPSKMPGAENDSPALVSLGKRLFFDTVLSENKSQSCNSCHAVDQGKAGVDKEPTSPGAFGKRGDRNSPTVWNAGFHLAQFWDGRAVSLEDQAKGPVLNPVEMAMPNESEVIRRLKASPEYVQSFAAAFQGETEPLTYDNMAKAIAAFERTLITHDRFDEFLAGNDSALSLKEKQGLKLFLDVGCTTCHHGPVLGANSYQKMGLVNAYENEADPGRMAVTKEEDDRFKFKVPSLRNIALTGPYFHDGKEAKLDAAVKRMAWMQLGRELTPEENELLVGYLRTLSGKGLAGSKP